MEQTKQQDPAKYSGKIKEMQGVILATTTKNERHNAELLRLRRRGVYKAPLHEILRHFTYIFRDQPAPTIQRLRDISVLRHHAEEIQSELKQKRDKEGCLCLLSISLPSGFHLEPWQSLGLVKMQLMAGMQYIRVFFGGDWSIEMCKDTFSEGKSLDKENKRVFVPSLDMNMNPAFFSTVYNKLYSKGYRFFSFIFRAPNKLSKTNYFFISNISDDGAKKHISGLSWRRRDTARSRTIPLMAWAIGFSSCAFGGRPSFVESDEDDEAQATTWNIGTEFIKFYNPNSKQIDRIQFFPITQLCFCPIHRGESIFLTAENFYETGVSAIFSSLHDMHEIQKELNNLGSRTFDKIREDNTLSTLYSWAVRKRINSL